MVGHGLNNWGESDGPTIFDSSCKALIDFLNIIDFLFDWDELLFMNGALYRATAYYAARNCRGAA
jgi:hypothetical protein